ncbi:MAG: Crp/Fnr family transcriptional regulator [Gammaproteobacteria bacterium]|nr:Crp/Fnr family transcriptional regulator [Gammaproteobacteria bacterium]
MNLEPELRALELFRGIPPRALDALAASCELRELATGQAALRHREPTSEVLVVLAGRLRATICSSSGHDIPFCDLERGDLFGELFAGEDEPVRADVLALAPTRLATISHASFDRLLRDHNEIAHRLLQHLSRMVRRCSARIVELGNPNVEQRVRAELLRLACDHAGDDNRAVIAPAPTLADVAGRVGTTREEVSREIARLKRASLVTRRGGALVVTDLKRLSALVAPVLPAR